jgi:hypothetical protein
VEDGNAKPPRDDRGKPAIRIAENQHAIRAPFAEHRLDSRENLADLIAEAVAARCEGNIWRSCG